MSARFKDKVALVTGGASGIGRAAARLLALEGALVVIADLDAAVGQKAAEAIGPSARFQSLDVASEASWQEAVDATIAAWGRLDVLVNSAGWVLAKNLEKTTLEEWRRQMAVNLDGVFLGTKAAILAMKATGGGAIVNIASIQARSGVHTAAAYCASKGGVTAFTRAAALHCARYGLGIRVNAVLPGYTETPMVEGLATARGDRERNRAAFIDLHPIGRLAQPEEIAAGVLYLASDDARFVTGTELVIDGGFTAR
ncbi:MAG: glucose 1-dehydrogenase [Alphaproteobacteria bacterium]|nr:glucose 1-dehydrogenase [Alphaproteobacteria bacterium]